MNYRSKLRTQMIRFYHRLPGGRVSFIMVCAALLFILALSWLSGAAAANDWWNNAWDYRVPVTVGAAGYKRTTKAAEVEINFSTLLDDLGRGGALDLDSIRVIEISAGGQLLDDEVPFQFDAAADFDAIHNARGTLILLLTGETAAGATRHYHVYFDTSGSFTPPPITPLVTLTDNVQDEGFDSYRITTDNATYFYHKSGGGFSSLVDADDLDWISWNATPGAAGDFRGIPNLVHPANGGYFHPGRLTSTSTILHQGPLKATFQSTSNDGLWEAIWEIFPDYARMTVVKVGSNYWFQYEGTPGGELEISEDFVVRSSGVQNLASVSWVGDLVGEEWVYLADPAVGRSIYVVQHTEDEIVDSYRPTTNGEMTIFAFGRENNSRYLSQVPKQFTFGLVDSDGLSEVAAAVRDAYRPLAISLGEAEQRSQPTATPTALSSPTGTQQPTSTPTATGTVEPSATPIATPSATLSPTPVLDYSNFLPLIGK